MSKLLIQCLFFVVWFVNLDCQYNTNRPKIITQNGDIIIEAALNKNIVLRPNGPNSAILAGDVNLKQEKTTEIGEQYQPYTNNFEKYFSGPNSILNRLEILENRTSPLAASARPPVLLARRVTRLLGKVAELQRQINEITSDGCESDPCQKGGTCLNLANGYHCLCPSNWEGKNCDIDVNECRNFAGTELGCQNGATCINKPGTYECFCSPGWYGLHCTRREKDCSQGNFEMCGHGTCVPSTSGKGFTCICDQGWETNGSSVECLTDINECDATRGPRCSVNPKVECVNWPGSFRCGQCPAGYEGDGFACHDINECITIPNGGCSPLVTCHNTVGSRICGSCPSGYTGDGITCTYKGSCNINHGGCHPSAQCVDTMSMVQCVCPYGMDGDGIGIHGCYVSTFGNFSRRCEDNPCGSHGQCHQLLTGYTCVCYKGYSGAHCDVAADTCSGNPCRNGGTCRTDNSVSGFRCECNAEYTGNLCERKVKSCGGYLDSEEGSIIYPLTNTSYSDNTKCAWVIHTIPSKVINVTFTKFNLEPEAECLYDFLQIHDGRTASSQLIGRFCGNQFPKGGNIVSSHNSLYFWFRSDDTRHAPGFALHWNSVDPICGGEINANTHGVITSPGSPGNYPPNRDCYWYLSTSPSKRIALSFFTLDIETHPNCSFDFLAIYNGRLSSDPLVNKYCSSTQPQPITTTSSEIMIHFHSDSHGSGHGFQISYASVDGLPGCGGLYTLDKGEITAPSYNGKYLNNLRCEYKISVRTDSKINLSFKSFDVENSPRCRYDYVKVYDGPTTEAKLIGKFCGSIYPKNVITSSSNSIVIIFNTDRNINRGGFRITYESVCQKTLHGDSGVITSPGYPFAYPTNIVCEYIISTEPGKAIQLTFQDFNVEDSRYYNCRYDFVEVRDGHDRNSTSIGKYCGRSRFPPTLVSTHNFMYLRFKTDMSNPLGDTYNGFYANYTTIDTECGGIFKVSTGAINFPKSGDRYKENQNCKWLIVAPEGMHIKLTWNSFDIESHGECISDYLELIEIDEHNKQESLGRYCGSTSPPSLTTLTTRLLLEFKSDHSNQGTGFSVVYHFMDSSKSCGGNYLKSQGYIYSPGWPRRYEPNRDCTWTIKVPAGQQIALNISQFDLERAHSSKCDMGDYLEVRNGLTPLSPLIGKYCGAFRTKRIASIANAIYIHFYSDFYITGNGFKIEWTSTATRCGGTLTGSSGSISSPNYPEMYNNNEECFYKILTSYGSRITMSFVELDLESSSSCRDDYVAIYDGADENAPIIGKYCSMSSLLHGIQTKSNIVFIKFRSDFYIRGKGFFLNYNTLCNNNITGLYGVIESPNYPNTYPADINCLWNITVPKGHTINVTFTHFDISDNHNMWRYRPFRRQCKDYVQYKESKDIGFSSKFCLYSPPLRSTKSNSLQIKFVSKDYFQRTGFRLEWVSVGCGGTIQKRSGSLSLDKTATSSREMECVWFIEAPIGKKITIVFDNAYMIDSTNCSLDSIEILNGRYTDSPLISKFCNDNINRYKSTSNYMTVRFVKGSDIKDAHFKARYSSYESGCGGPIRSQSGMIYSPNYPANYDNDLNCIWMIIVPKNHRIELNFMFLDLYSRSSECNEDYIAIYNGTDIINANTSQKICSRESSAPIISSGNRMTLQFTTNDRDTAKGFKANFTMICGATIDAITDGIITNDDYISHSNRNCIWIIKAPRLDQKITLTITHMSIPKTPSNVANISCSSFLRILDGDDENAPLVNEYCGSYTPRIVSHGSALTIVLGTHTDKIEGKFTAHYTSLDNACGGTLTSETGEVASPNYPLPYPPNSDCEWTLSTSPGNRVYINFEEFDLESSTDCFQDYVEIRENDGGGRLVGVFCGGAVPTNTTVGSKLYIKFRSDGTGSSKGFMFKYGFLHGNEITGLQSGEIASPLYPHMFRTAGVYTWRVIVPRNTISLTITRLVIHTRGDTCTNNLVIYDGYDEEANVLENVCGVLRDNKESLRSTSDVVLIKLSLDEFNTGSLFHIRWNENEASFSYEGVLSNINCGSNETQFVSPATPIFITSPNYPNKYNDGSNCQWIFTTSPGRHLEIEFPTFHLEHSPSCFADYVSVYSSNVPTEWNPVRTDMCVMEDATGLNASTYMKINFVSDSNVQLKGFQGRVASVCGGTYDSRSGIVRPTWFDWDNAFSEFNCEWKIKVRPGRQMKVEFITFNITNVLNDCRVYVFLRNGESLESPPMAKYCGYEHETRTILETSGNGLHVSFKGVRQRPYQGFELKYSEKNIECGGRSTLSTEKIWDIINSPNFPLVSVPFTECVWVFSAPLGEVLRIDFIDRFDLDNSNSDCLMEYVEVRDGATEFAPLLGRFCDTKPGTIRTSNNLMYIKYSTQVAEPRNGFKANVSIHVCGGTIYASEGEITSPGYPHMASLPYNTVCTWQLIGRMGYTFSIRLQDIFLPDGVGCSVNMTIDEEIPENNTVNALKSFCSEEYVDHSKVLQSLTNKVTITLKMGALANYAQTSPTRGFKFTFNSSMPYCTGSITTPDGYLNTPSYPRQTTIRYCHWIVTVPNENRRVTLELLDYDKDRHRIGMYSNNDRNYVSTIQNIPSDDFVPSNKIFESTGNSLIIYVWLDAPTGSTHRFQAKFSSDQPALCGGSLSGSTGSLISPALNRSYTCRWRYNADSESSNTTIVIKTQLNSSSQSVQCRRIDPNLSLIYHVGKNMKLQTISVCRQTDTIYRIPSNAIEIMAKKNKKDSLYFNINWNTQPCGGFITASESSVNILNIPRNYTDTIDCAWIISVPNGNRVELTLAGSFKFECSDEYLKIFPNSGQNTMVIGDYCSGKTQERSLLAEFSRLHVEYHSKPRNDTSLTLTIKLTNNQCGSLMTEEATFSSPNYPKTYSSNSECEWEIKTDLGSRISLVFIDRFAIEGTPGSCTEDAVIIYDWKGNKYSEIVRLCGRERPISYNSTYNRMKVVLRTNDQINLDGFRAQWKRICGGTFIATEEEQFLYSPGYPESYPPYMNCVYEITAYDKEVNVKFLDFLLEGPYPECASDQLNITTQTDFYRYSHSTYCGSELPELFHSKSVEMHFKTDSYVSKSGFKLSFWSTSCNGIIKEPTVVTSHIDSEFLGNMNCSWKIEGPHDKIVVLNFIYFTLENFDDCSNAYVAIYDGLNMVNDKRLILLCGRYYNSSSIVVKSNNNTMLMNFISDSYVYGKGFKVAISFSYSESVGCGGHINLTSSTILKSPFISSQLQYDNYLDCHWTIIAPRDHVIKINFISFHIAPCQDVNQTALGMNNCDCDYVQLIDGNNLLSPVINKYCGHTLPMEVSSSRNSLKVILHSDGEYNSTGFEATLSIEESICGQSNIMVNDDRPTVIRSPNYQSGSIPRGLHCVYNIDATSRSHYITHVHIKNLDLQPNSNTTGSNRCDKDRLVISPIESTRNGTLGKNYVMSNSLIAFIENPFMLGNIEDSAATVVLCGRKKSMDFYFVGNVKLTVQTSPLSDSTESSYKGFEIELSGGAYCSKNYSEPSGRVKLMNALFNNLSHANNDCYTLITAPENHTVSAYFISLSPTSWSEAAHLKIYDGNSTSNKELKTINRDFDGIQTAFSTGRYMLIHAPITKSEISDSNYMSYDLTYVSSERYPGCGGKLMDILGRITSPMYPDRFRQKATCEWELQTPPGTRLVLQFFSFDLGVACNQVYLQLVDRKGNVISQYCDEYPAKYTSPDNYVKIVFVSTKNNGGLGWVAEFFGM